MQSEPRPKKLLDPVRDAIRLKHYSHRTEQTYVQWIRRYILFCLAPWFCWGALPEAPPLTPEAEPPKPCPDSCWAPRPGICC